MKERKYVPLSECTHGSKYTPCNKYCPFELPVRDIMEKLKKGSFIAAYNMYRENVLFPEVVCEICSKACVKGCHDELKTELVNFPALEKFLVENFKTKDPVNYGVASLGKKVAVLGASLRGVTAALKFGQSGYTVTVFEKEDRICPELDSYLNRETIEHGIMSQFKFASCSFEYGCDYANINTADFDILIDAAELSFEGSNVYTLKKPALLENEINAGKNLQKAIDWTVKTGSEKEPDPLYIEEIPAEYLEEKAEIPAYDKPAARAEANKCTGCDCSLCLEACTMLRDYGESIADLSRSAGLAVNLFKHAETREGTRQIYGCTDCGLCKNICPKGIDIGAFLVESKNELHRQGVIPHAYHDYWLRDFANADSDNSALFYMPKENAKYMFFPGCQAGASDPRYITMTYEKLLKENDDTALLLLCCGAPLKWSGDVKAMDEEHAKIRSYWEKAGKPVIVTGCPSCHKFLKENLDDVEVVMLYDLLKLDEGSKSPFDKAAVFDPCSARDYEDVQIKVRTMAKDAGVELDELKYHGKMTQCCSFAGNPYDIQRDVTNQHVKDRMNESELPYICYCTNCRDIFASKGKPVRHMLDIILGINEEERGVPSLQQRRTNRYNLKKELIEKYGIDAKQDGLKEMLNLYMDDKLREKMDVNLIMEEDVSETVKRAEETGFFVTEEESGHRFTHLLRGIITYWVEYVPEGDGYRVFNTYSHRMTISDDVITPQER